MKGTIRRLPPCPCCDVEKMESWLQDMAREGLILEKEGISRGLVRFRREAPRTIQYRLFSGWQEPTLKNIWQSKNALPPKEEKEFHASYGWNYVARRDCFSIYAREGETGREMHTDPAVQAIDIQVVSKWVRWTQGANLIGSTVLLIFLLLLMAWTGGLFSFLAEAAFFLLAALVLLGFLGVDTGRQLAALGRLRRKLQSGEPLDHHKPWRKGAAGHRVFQVLVFLLLVLCLVWGVFLEYDLMRGTPIQNGVYPGDQPFPSVSELIPEGEFFPDLDIASRTMYAEDGNDLCPVKIQIWEEGTLVLPEGQRQTVFLYTEYYETRSPRLADYLARTLLEEDQSDPDRAFEALPAMDLGVEEETIYRAGSWGTRLLFRDGTRVLRSVLYQESGSAISLEHWAARMAESIQSEERSAP